MKKYTVKPTKRYKKDYRRLRASTKDLSKLDIVINTLAQGTPLNDSFKDHPLKGDLAGSRICHVGPDWLLLYKKKKQELILLLLSTGTHRDVLGIE